MTNNDTLEKNPATPELIKAELTVLLSKEGLAYQTLLQDSENVVFTKDNINEERTALVNLRKVKAKLESIENPHTKAWSDWNKARKSLVDPVASLLTKKEQDFRAVSREIEAENAKIEAEKQRVAGIKQAIDNFFIEQSQAIANAKNPEEIVRIEKLIGSHRSASRYAEFLPTMTEKAQVLAELIKTQKDAIKKIGQLRAKESLAMEIGDDEVVLELREQQEQITANLEQGKVDVQERAIQMATKSDVVEAEIIVPAAPKPRRSVWQWDIVDLKQTAKKMPEWVSLDINTGKVEEYLKAKKVEGIEGESFEFAGLKFWLEKSY